jgi:large subunit ribosomal protein L24
MQRLPKMKVKKGDHVVVIAGKDKGSSGTIIAVYPDRQKVLVQGVNMIKKNKKVNYQGARGAKEGGIVNEEGPIHVSNVALVDPDSKKAARAGYEVNEDGAKVRVARPSGKEV